MKKKFTIGHEYMPHMEEGKQYMVFTKDIPPFRKLKKGEKPGPNTKIRDLCVHAASWAEGEELLIKKVKIILNTPQNIPYEMEIQ